MKDNLSKMAMQYKKKGKPSKKKDPLSKAMNKYMQPMMKK